MWPSWIVLTLVILAGLYFFAIYRREGTFASYRFKFALTFLRCLLVILIVLMLGELDLRIDRRGLPYLALIIDDSASMTVPDQYSDAKIQAAAQSLAESVDLSSTSRMDLAKGILLTRQSELLRKLS